MKKIIFSITFLFAITTVTHANINALKKLDGYVDIKNQNEEAFELKVIGNGKLLLSKSNIFEAYTWTLSCGQSVQYCAPDGDSWQNIMNARINFNNAICGTNIPSIPYEELEP